MTHRRVPHLTSTVVLIALTACNGGTRTTPQVQPLGNAVRRATSVATTTQSFAILATDAQTAKLQFAQGTNIDGNVAASAARQAAIELQQNASINGNVGAIASQTTLSLEQHASISGTAYVPAGTQVQVQQGASIGGGVSNAAPVPSIASAVAAAQTTSASDASLPVTIASPTTIDTTQGQSVTITGTASVNVVDLSALDLAQNSSLTFSGAAGESFVVNVAGEANVQQNAQVRVSGGITAGDVVFNFTGANGEIQLQQGVSFQGSILALSRPNVEIQQNAVVGGSVIADGQNLQLQQNAVVQNTAPSAAPTSPVWIGDAFGGNQLLHYAANANGSVTPTQALVGGKHARGIAFDASGNLYVAEGNQGVAFYPAPLSAASIATRTIGPGPLCGGGATAIAVQAGVLYVAGGPCGSSGAVSVFPTNWSGTAPTPTAVIDTGLGSVNSIAVDPSGNIYVANSGNGSSVLEFAPIGTQTGTLTPAPSRTIPGCLAAQECLGGIATDSSGNLYVGNGNNPEIAVFPPSTAVTTPTYTLSTYAGNGCGLWSVAVDNAGNMWMLTFECGTSQQSIVEFAPVASGTTGSVVEAPVLALNPGIMQWGSGNGLAVDPSGNVWTANDYTTTITGYAIAGLSGTVNNPTASTTITQGPDTVFGPAQLAFDNAGNLWTPNSNATLAEFSPSGGALSFAALLAPPNLGCPVGLAFDASGNMYVADVCGQVVSVFAPPFTSNSVPVRTLQVSGLGAQTQIALDANNNLYVLNESNNSVVIYPAGAGGAATPLATITSSGGSIASPTGIAVDDVGNIYVYNSSGSGSVSVFPPGSNGAATPSRIITVYDGSGFQLAVDKQLNLYVSTGSGFAVYGPTANGSATPIRNVTSSQQLSGMGIVLSP
ncbi:MAG TPA: choice-of-anchor A family protein [Candidatus Baltobacteraceae bacterium]|nr:choice-of-anchor A family protein [Candidatus Baltobacteraceae bacterium]